MSDAQTGIIYELSNGYDPICHLNTPNRQLLCSRASLIQLNTGERLVQQQVMNWLVFLIHGDLQPVNGKAAANQNNSATKQPLFYNSKKELVAKTPCKLVRFDRNLFDQIRSEQQMEEMKIVETEVSEGGNLLLDLFYEALQNNALTLPSLPEVATKVNSAMQRANISNDDLARIIHTDPTLAARLLQVANSAAYRGNQSVDCVKSAITRLGLETTRNITLLVATKHLFQHKTPLIQLRLKQLYQRSGYVAALAFVLARKVKSINPERALLAGLLHDIGEIPLLNYAGEHSDTFDNEIALDEAIGSLKVLTSTIVLQEWDFDSEMLNIVQNINDYKRDTGEPLDCQDVVIAAHALSNAEKSQALLKGTVIEKKLIDHNISISQPELFLKEAREEILSAQQLLQ